MKLIYSPRAIADIKLIGEISQKTFGEDTALGVETCIRATIARIAVLPESYQLLSEVDKVRMAPIVRYPFKIFYTQIKNSIIILHIRHTSRKDWTE